MLLSTFIAGVSENPRQQLRFQVPATVDKALQIAVTVFEAEAQGKRNLTFSRVLTHMKSRGNFDQPWKTFERSEYGQAAVLTHTDRMQAGSNVSKTPAGLTLAAKRNRFVLSAEHQDTLPENVIQTNFLPERTREEMGKPNHKKQESQAALMLKLIVETPLVRKTCNLWESRQQLAS